MTQIPQTEVVNAIITSAQLSRDSDAIFVDISLMYDSVLNQDLTRMLWTRVAEKPNPLMGAGFIYRLLNVAGVTEWSQLKGRPVRVNRVVGWNGHIKDLGHIINETWLGACE